MKNGVFCSLLSVVYVLVAYMCPILWFCFANEEASAKLNMVLLVPVILGVFNVLYVIINYKKLNRFELLRSALIVKYLLIPLYIVGGIMVALCFLLTFTPVIFMIVVGPLVAGILSIYGYLILLGGSAFSIAYVVKAKSEGAHGGFLSIAGIISQVFFFFDVVAMGILSIKEKKYVPATVTVIGVMVLGFFSICAAVIVSVMGTFR